MYSTLFEKVEKSVILQIFQVDLWFRILAGLLVTKSSSIHFSLEKNVKEHRNDATVTRY